MNKLIHGPNLSGQSLADRVTAAKHSLAGQGLAKSVCKSTTEEVMGPKKKHLDYLIQCTNEPNVSIPQLANLLIERTQNINWVVTFKGLVAIHNVMNYGNERFTQYLASNNCTFQLSAFIDKSNVQGYDMSTYIRRYAKYLNEKAVSYRLMAFDFCKVKRGKDDGLLRTMNTEKLLKTLPVLQSQLDALLEFDVTPNELTNGVINATFMLLFKDLIRLFACYNDGIINLLEKYFEMNKKNCKEALDLYKRFLVRMERTSEFLSVCESVGIDKGDIPDLAKAPASLLEALEEHLKSLESSKKSGSHSKPANVTSAINSFAAAASSGVNAANISDEEKRRILDDESRHLDQMREQRLKEHGATSPTAVNNPFSASSPTKQQSVDLFGPSSPTVTAPPNKASDDLFGLAGANPFADMGATAAPPPANMANNPFAPVQPSASAAAASPWGSPAVQANQQPAMHNGSGFASDAHFAAAFASQVTPGQNAGLDMSRASGHAPGATSPAMPAPRFDGFGQLMQPTIQPVHQTQTHQSTKFVPGDLDSSLASLAGNLNINPSTQQLKKTDHQWTGGMSGGEKRMTGGSSGWAAPVASSTFQPGMTAGAAPVQTGGMNMMGQPQQPLMAAGYNQQPVGGVGGQRPIAAAQPSQVAWGTQPAFSTQQQSKPNDPFGAL